MYIGLVLFFSSSVQNLTTQDCDGPACRVVMTYNKHSVALTFDTRYSNWNWEHMYSCMVLCLLCRSIEVAHWFDFWPFGHMGVLWSNYSVMLVK